MKEATWVALTVGLVFGGLAAHTHAALIESLDPDESGMRQALGADFPDTCAAADEHSGRGVSYDVLLIVEPDERDLSVADIALGLDRPRTDEGLAEFLGHTPGAETAPAASSSAIGIPPPCGG